MREGRSEMNRREDLKELIMRLEEEEEKEMMMGRDTETEMPYFLLMLTASA